MGSTMVELIAQTQVQSKDVEEIENKEDLGDDEMLVHLSIRNVM